MAFRILDATPGSSARRFLLSGAIWFLVATLVGLLIATELVTPDMVTTPELTFGRLRQVHVDTNVFGTLSMLLMGAMLFAVARLASMRGLWSERLGNLSMWLFNAGVLGGILTLPFGFNTTHEYGDYIWPVDVFFMTAFGLLLINVLQTLRRRREPLLYVTAWYAVGALIATLIVFSAGNFVWHTHGLRIMGMEDAEWSWFYAHNIFGTWLTPLSLGACYFWLPREAEKPLYSHTLSMIGFWPYFAFYLQVGAHHLIEAPAPAWLKLIAEIYSVGLLVPVYAFLANQWMTLRGAWWRLADNVVLKFLFAGTVFYFFVSTEGSLLALPGVERVTHFTEIVIGHAHLGLLGFSAFIACGAGYAVLREMYGMIWSERLAHLQYWCMLIGIVGFTLVLDDAGFLQGEAWRNGEVVYRVLPELVGDLTARAMFGCFVIAGAAIQLYNFIRTMRAARLAAAAPAELAEAGATS